MPPFHPKHFLRIQGLHREEILFLLDTAESFQEISKRDIKKVPTLRGKTIVHLFFEPSTRTRTSFEIAAKRLSADTLNISSSSSSVTKGETLVDTARNLVAMAPDAIVIRHSASGAADLIASEVDCSVINGGDGAHEHPSQALLDLLTMRQRKGGIEGLEVAIVGDILHSRVARSNLHALRALGARVRLAGPPTLLPLEFAEFGATLHFDLREAVRGADVVMMLRVQQERQASHFFPSLDEYAKHFCLTEEILREADPEVVVMHPGPINRGVEIASSVADGPYSVILDQVTNGIAVRMALLYVLIGGGRGKKA
jgi:aspartate carbamoyltransferase catalytic subunit